MRIEPNETRNAMIEKTKCLFDLIIDDGNKGPTVAETLTHLCKFEAEWGKYPKAAEEIDLITPDNLAVTLISTQYG